MSVLDLTVAQRKHLVRLLLRKSTNAARKKHRARLESFGFVCDQGFITQAGRQSAQWLRDRFYGDAEPDSWAITASDMRGVFTVSELTPLADAARDTLTDVLNGDAGPPIELITGSTTFRIPRDPSALRHFLRAVVRLLPRSQRDDAAFGHALS